MSREYPIILHARDTLPILPRIRIGPATFCRWRDKYGGLGAPDLRRLKELEQENKKLKSLVADLVLDKQILQEAPSGKL